MTTLVYFDKEDADFLSHSTCLYSTQDWGIEVHRGEVPNGASKSVMHFYEDQISALTAYKIFEELDHKVCLGSCPMEWQEGNPSHDWVVVVDDPETYERFVT